MPINDLMDTYVSIAYGYEISQDIKKKIYNFVCYMFDNDYNYDFILNYLLQHGTKITDELYENSLLKPNKFYYHSELRIMPDTSIWNPNIKEISKKFYLEMKTQYSIEDLLSYFYGMLSVPNSLRNHKRDKGALESLLKQYHIEGIETIDLILFAIDYNIDNKESISSPFDLKIDRDLLARIIRMVESSVYKKVIWRD